jgi:hypothetical protein
MSESVPYHCHRVTTKLQLIIIIIIIIIIKCQVLDVGFSRRSFGNNPGYVHGTFILEEEARSRFLTELVSSFFF